MQVSKGRANLNKPSGGLIVFRLSFFDAFCHLSALLFVPSKYYHRAFVTPTVYVCVCVYIRVTITVLCCPSLEVKRRGLRRAQIWSTRAEMVACVRSYTTTTRLATTPELSVIVNPDPNMTYMVSSVAKFVDTVRNELMLAVQNVRKINVVWYQNFFE